MVSPRVETGLNLPLSSTEDLDTLCVCLIIHLISTISPNEWMSDLIASRPLTWYNLTTP